jgi:catechol 2,3-dioxygenase-like lactoylglutathione lyase family enzyme
MTSVSMRYFADDVDAAIAFYTEQLGFAVDVNRAPHFASLTRGDLRLLLNSPRGSGWAAQPASDGRRPEPGGWNRLQLQVDDLASEVDHLRAAGAPFRGEIVNGFGGKQIVLDDPSGNPVELFEPPPPRNQ